MERAVPQQEGFSIHALRPGQGTYPIQARLLCRIRGHRVAGHKNTHARRLASRPSVASTFTTLAVACTLVSLPFAFLLPALAPPAVATAMRRLWLSRRASMADCGAEAGCQFGWLLAFSPTVVWASSSRALPVTPSQLLQYCSWCARAELPYVGSVSWYCNAGSLKVARDVRRDNEVRASPHINLSSAGRWHPPLRVAGTEPRLPFIPRAMPNFKSRVEGCWMSSGAHSRPAEQGPLLPVQHVC